MGIRIQYTAILNPNGVNKLAYKHGFRPPRDTVESRVGFINKFIAENGDDGITEFLSIHPDKSLIMENLADEIRIQNSNGNEFDNWVEAISGAVKGATDVAGKAIGTGKRGREAQRQTMAHERSMATTDLVREQMANKAAKEKANKRILYIAIGGGILLLIAIVVVLIFVLKKNK